jgi:hypothetical protein
MKFKQLNEGVKYNELKSLVKSTISVADFEPKVASVNEVTVVSFYTKDERPADDLARFLERSIVDILDTEVSPVADDNGYYLVFVEIKNENLMHKVFAMLEDVSRLIDINDWTIDFFNGKSITVSNDDINNWLKNNKE